MGWFEKSSMQRKLYQSMRRYEHIVEAHSVKDLSTDIIDACLSPSEARNGDLRIMVRVLLACARGAQRYPDCGPAFALIINSILDGLADELDINPVNNAERSVIEQASRLMAGC